MLNDVADQDVYADWNDLQLRVNASPLPSPSPLRVISEDGRRVLLQVDHYSSDDTFCGSIHH